MEVERSFLANLVMGGIEEAKKVDGIIDVSDFSIDIHQEVYRAIMEFVKKDKSFDAALLANHLKDNSFLAQPESSYPVRFGKVIADIIQWYMSPKFQKEYIAKFIQRRLTKKVLAIVGKFQEKQEPDLTEFFSQVDSVKAQVEQTSSLTLMYEVMREALESQKKKEGIEFHFSLLDFDNYLGGLGRGELLLIGAFTSQGKSSLCLQIAIDFAEQGKRVLFCSSEMSELEMARRTLANYFNLSVSDLRMTRIEEGKIEELDEAVEAFQKWQFGICVISQASQVKENCLKFRPDIVIVDHLHNLSGEGSLYEKTTRNIKSLKETTLLENVGMVVASQLHRSQDDKIRPPRISDLRGSGDIEETANSVILLYWKNQRENKELTSLEEMEVRLVKNRDGRTGKFGILFEPKFCRFKDLEVRHVANSES